MEMEKMKKPDQVYYYLKGLLEKGEMSEKRLFSLSLKDLKQMEGLKGIGKNSLSEGYKEFKLQHSTFVQPDGDSVDPVPSGDSGDLSSFLNELKDNREFLLEMLDEYKTRKHAHEVDLTQNGIGSLKNHILQQFPVNVPAYNEGHGLGVRISHDVFDKFKNMVSQTGLTQRQGLHVALMLFISHCENIINEYNGGVSD